MRYNDKANLSKAAILARRGCDDSIATDQETKMTSATIPASVIVAAQAAHKTFYSLGPFASVTLAQWAVESDYGRAMPAGSNNPFGIKAFGDQPYVEAMT